MGVADENPEEVAVDHPPSGGRRWAWRLAVAGATVVGLAIRVAAVLAHPHLVAHGDADFYHLEANLLVEGKGWISPFIYSGNGHLHVATAAFPPLFTVILAMCSLVGWKTFLAHRLWCAVIGTTAVPLGAWVGREVGGRRVALIAAFAIAVYPNLWMSDALGLSETLSPVLVLGVLGTAYRLWRQPTVGRAAWLGLAFGLAALGRDELALMVPIILVPLCLTRRVSVRRRILMLVAGLGVAGIVVGPWVGYNMSRFSKPVFISDGLGITLASANCDSTWNGPFEGYWSLPCATAANVNLRADESVQGAEAQTFAIDYIKKHLNRLPAVEVARLGRAFGFYRPIQQIDLDAFIEGRPRFWAFVGLWMWYSFAALSAVGTVMMRRRRVTVLPMVAVLADVVASVLLTFGQTRYRATLEVVVVLLSAVAIDGFLRWREPRPTADPPEPSRHPVDEREVLVVIPALDEERSVAGVVQRVSAVLPAASVLVVDDGSSDATAVLARAAGADVAASPFTLGVGGAMRVGFRYAVSHGFRAVIQVDADGQHEPTDLPRLLAVLDGGERPHVVVGCRFGSESSGPSTPLLRRVAMRSLASYVSQRTGSRLDDVTSGFRAHNRAAIELFARHYPAEYLSDTVESLVLAHQAGARLDQVPVHMHAREAGAPSQSTFWSIAYLARVSLILVLGLIRRRPDLDLAKGAPWPAST